MKEQDTTTPHHRRHKFGLGPFTAPPDLAELMAAQPRSMLLVQIAPAELAPGEAARWAVILPDWVSHDNALAFASGQDVFDWILTPNGCNAGSEADHDQG